MTKREMKNLKNWAKELLNKNGIKAFQKDIHMLEANGYSYLTFEHKGVEYQYSNCELSIYRA